MKADPMASNYPHPIIAKEGWPFLAIAFSAACLATYCCAWWSILTWIIFFFILQFFRDPARNIPTDANAVLSPADGRIVVVDEVDDPYLNRRALKISVFMNVFNVHSNRSPVDGTVKQRWYVPGSFVNADLDKASLENERNALWIQTGKHDVTCVQIAGLIARRILCYVDAEALLKRGQRYGFIRFGSRVDVYLPLGSVSNVTIGDKVSASSTILATLPE